MTEVCIIGAGRSGITTATCQLPSVAEQEEVMRADEAFHLEQCYSAPRHTIQVDFGRYCVDLHREIAAGEARAREAAAGFTG